MLYDIYFHNDFDGLASAAVMLNFLRSRGDEIEHFIPLDLALLPQWRDEKFFEKHKFFRGKRNLVIVVDFPYHPKAVFWFDHHPTTFQKESWRRKFKPTKLRRYDPAYKSACHFVEASLRRNFGWKPPKHFKELVKWLDIVDGAGYRSAKQTIDIMEPALQVDAFIDDNSYDKATAQPLVELLSEKPLTEIARDPRVKKAVAETRKKIRRGLMFYRKNIKVDGKTTFIDLASANIGKVRFAPYYLYPASVYAIRMERKGKFFYLGVTANSWRRQEDKIHIGEFLRRKYGGGGHKGAGGAYFNDEEAAKKAVAEIISKFR